MPTEALAMPFRGELRAPSFSENDDEKLLEFFDRFDALADECNLSEDEKCRDILRYVDFRSRQLWLTLDSYESGDYKEFKDEVVYQYPAALKAAQRCSAQLARHRMLDNIERPPQIVHSPASNVPTSTAFDSCLSELSSPSAQSSPPLVFRYDQPVSVPVARPVHAVPAPPAHLACPVLAPVVHPASPFPRSVHAASVDRPSHAAPAPCHALLIARPENAAPPPFTFRPTFVPPVFNPTPLPFPLCPTPALSASVTAQVPPSAAEVEQLERASIRPEPRECRSNAGHAVVEDQKEEVEYSSHRCQEDAEDVAVQKEEGRGWKSDVLSSDDEDERYHAIDKVQEEKTGSQQLDEDNERETADGQNIEKRRIVDEDQARETGDEDRTGIADEEQLKLEERQKSIEEIQQK